MHVCRGFPSNIELSSSVPYAALRSVLCVRRGSPSETTKEVVVVIAKEDTPNDFFDKIICYFVAGCERFKDAMYRFSELKFVTKTCIVQKHNNLKGYQIYVIRFKIILIFF